MADKFILGFPISEKTADSVMFQDGTDVGIGTDSPEARLSVYSTGQSDVAGTGVIELGVGSTKYWNVRQAQTPAGDLAIDRTHAGVSSEAFRIQRSTGNVAIGVAPVTGVRLNIAGGVIRNIDTYNNTTANAANLVVSSGGTFERSTSSLKYKTDVRDYDKGLNEVMQLQPKYYKGKDDGDTQFAGLIAEDVHNLGLTEFVQYADDGTPDALAYTHMVALLVKSIQELKAEIELLKLNTP